MFKIFYSYTSISALNCSSTEPLWSCSWSFLTGEGTEKNKTGYSRLFKKDVFPTKWRHCKTSPKELFCFAIIFTETPTEKLRSGSCMVEDGQHWAQTAWSCTSARIYFLEHCSCTQEKHFFFKRNTVSWFCERNSHRLEWNIYVEGETAFRRMQTSQVSTKISSENIIYQSWKQEYSVSRNKNLRPLD